MRVDVGKRGEQTIKRYIKNGIDERERERERAEAREAYVRCVS
jgi:hypothetical protein